MLNLIHGMIKKGTRAFYKGRKIIKIISLSCIILGLVLFTIIITIGRTNESLQPTLTRLVQIYLYCTMLLTIISGLLGYIGRKK